MLSNLSKGKSSALSPKLSPKVPLFINSISKSFFSNSKTSVPISPSQMVRILLQYFFIKLPYPLSKSMTDLFPSKPQSMKAFIHTFDTTDPLAFLYPHEVPCTCSLTHSLILTEPYCDNSQLIPHTCNYRRKLHSRIYGQKPKLMITKRPSLN